MQRRAAAEAGRGARDNEEAWDQAEEFLEDVQLPKLSWRMAELIHDSDDEVGGWRRSGMAGFLALMAGIPIPSGYTGCRLILPPDFL